MIAIYFVIELQSILWNWDSSFGFDFEWSPWLLLVFPYYMSKSALSHIWLVALLVQFYLITPLIIWMMMKMPKAELVTVILFVSSACYGMTLTILFCSGPNAQFHKSPATMAFCDDLLAPYKYYAVIFRIAPYMAGIQSAYDYLNPQVRNSFTLVFVEWFCLFGLIFIHAVGPDVAS